MTSARTSGAVSGAASGAAYGSVLGPWGALAGGVIGGVAGLISGGAADAQFANQQAWRAYNQKLKFTSSMYNIDSNYKLSMMNAATVMGMAGINARAIEQGADYNAAIIYGTTVYNNELRNQEIAQIWQDENLALEQLELYRAREAGTIVSRQSASGTVIGEDSNADVLISQNAQREMDKNIIMFGADRNAAIIRNRKAQSSWQGQVAIGQTLWEGEMQSYITKTNAAVQALSISTTARIKSRGDTWSARMGYVTDGYEIAMQESQFDEQNTQNMIGGLFKAGATYAGYSFASKVPGSSATFSTGGGSTGGAAPPMYLSNTAPAYSGSGTSLMVR